MTKDDNFFSRESRERTATRTEEEETPKVYERLNIPLLDAVGGGAEEVTRRIIFELARCAYRRS